MSKDNKYLISWDHLTKFITVYLLEFISKKAVASIPNVEAVRIADVSEYTSELFINNVKGTFIYHLGH